MNITEAESQIMQALWRKTPLTADEIVADVRGRQPWAEA
ncbi:MAG: BlaI/MecI/CopY family transcriptional regulator, partial [Phenylobacterium sp.]|nr:BlaI/MecI/CopY family transcriptional regulator [Phenylobacterium sp.]